MASPKLIAATLLVLLAAHGALADTACQRARERDQKSTNPYVIHECDAQGNYLPKQKTVGTPHWYWCFTPDGEVAMGPSKKIQKCECPLERHAASAARPPRTAPTCTNSGHFQAKQQDSTGQWCVNPDTGAKTKDKVALSKSLTC